MIIALRLIYFLSPAPTHPSGTNWVGQILTDLVVTSQKNNEAVEDEDLEEFPYLEVGDVEKYQVDVQY